VTGALAKSGGLRVTAIMPALNEAESIGEVLAEMPWGSVHEAIVVDGGSGDDTAAVARARGARVVQELRRGYGWACAAGLAAAESEVVVCLDGDGTDDPTQIPSVLGPVLQGEADLVLGSRLRGTITAGAMPFHQRLGNRVSGWLVRVLYRVPITDISPFRAARRLELMDLGLTEMTYGWPTEMLVKAVRRGWRVTEVPVGSRPRRAGHSKIIGTPRGTLLATWHILATLLHYSSAQSDQGKGP
jgi:glycosyltransferase involved in cell wall biosynthesis